MKMANIKNITGNDAKNLMFQTMVLGMMAAVFVTEHVSNTPIK